jgi:hypothetical protein
MGLGISHSFYATEFKENLQKFMEKVRNNFPHYIYKYRLGIAERVLHLVHQEPSNRRRALAILVRPSVKGLNIKWVLWAL